jgi:hypothetical protein
VSLAGFYGAMVLALWSNPPDLSPSGAVWISTVCTGSAIAGYVARRERELLEQRISDQESDAGALARRVLLSHTEQRVAIANELRSVIAASLRAIADAADAPDAAERSDVLERISDISRVALGDLRRVLARLRSADAAPRYAPMVAMFPAVDATGQSTTTDRTVKEQVEAAPAPADPLVAVWALSAGEQR